MMMDADQQRRIHNLYNSTRWAKIRRQQLQMFPLCQALCAEKNLVTPADHVHHVIQHHGSKEIFFSSPLLSVCARCHAGPIGQAERIGFTTDIGVDGLPIDRRHPYWRQDDAQGQR